MIYDVGLGRNQPVCAIDLVCYQIVDMYSCIHHAQMTKLSNPPRNHFLLVLVTDGLLPRLLLGLDYSDCWSLPGDTGSYIQEIGRVVHDNLPAKALLH